MSLHLLNFTAVFQLLVVYNLAVGVGGESVNKFVPFIGNLNKRIQELLKKVSFIAGQIKPSFKKKKRHAGRIHKKLTRLNLKASFLFGDKKILEASVKPYYIFFGLYSFMMLLVSGTISEWNEYYCLMLFNTIGFIVAGIGALKSVFFLHEECQFWSPTRISLLFLLLFGIAFSIPEAYAFHLLPVTTSNVCFQNCLVIGSLLLALSPILIHMIIILRFYGRVKFYSQKTNRIKAEVAIAVFDDMNLPDDIDIK